MVKSKYVKTIDLINEQYIKPYARKMTTHTLLVETMLFMHSKQFDALDTHYKYLIIELVEIARKEEK